MSNPALVPWRVRRTGSHRGDRPGSAFLLLAICAHLLAGGIRPLAAQSPAPTSGVIGVVVDAESLQPLGSVQVSVHTPRDSVPLSLGLSDANGRFILPGLPPGSFEVRFSRLGYSTAVRTIELGSAEGQSSNLGSIALSPAAVELAEINVIGERSAVIVAADRDIYSVDAMPSAVGGSATDVLAEVPELEVDVEGKVTLRGASPTIYINGRPAPMQGESLDIFLQQFPAENIENIEVMANPSARYQAEGDGGIVNIVLKRGASLGMSGNAFLNGGTRGQLGTGGRVTYQSGPWTVLGGSSLRFSRNETFTSDLRRNLLTDPISYLGQDAFSDRSTWSGNLDLNLEYALRPATTLSTRTRLFRNVAAADRTTTYTEMDAERMITDRYDRLIADDASGFSTDLALELKHQFAPRTHELSAQVRLNQGRDSEDSFVRRRILEELGEIDFAHELTWEEDRTLESELSFELDYHRPMGGRGQLEIGYRGEFGETDDGKLRQIEIENGLGEPTHEIRSGFLDQQNINAVYLTLIRRFGELNAQVGLRAEHVDRELGLPDRDDRIGNSHFGIFPNVNLTYGLGQGKRIRFSYSVRVRRPSSSVLNPTDQSNDPLNRRVGNPEIEPQTTHSFGLDASWSGSLGTLRLSPFYRHSVDEWERFKIVDSYGISTSTWANLGMTDAYGASLTASIREVHGFGGSVSLNGQRQETAPIALLDLPGRTLDRWSVRSNLSARVTPSINLQSSITYNPARDLPQGRSAATVMTSLGVRQRLLDGRVSANLNLTDPFDLYRPSTQTFDRSHEEVGRERPSMRRLSLSFSYNFGGRARPGGGRGGPGGPGGAAGPAGARGGPAGPGGPGGPGGGRP